MSQPLNIIIVERLGTLKSLAIKDFKLEELFKKCGFKKSDDFVRQVEWNVKYDSKKSHSEAVIGRNTANIYGLKFSMFIDSPVNFITK